MTKEQLQLELIYVCKSLRHRGLVNATHGNVSVRYKDIMFITPTGSDLETVKKEELVAISIKSGLILSDGIPSKEYEMHLLCYRNRPDIQGVVHAHTPKSVAAGCVPHQNPQDIVPAYTLAFALFTKHLPMIGYYKAGSHELAVQSSKILSTHNAVLLEHHGLITVADSVRKAYYRLEEIEENCEIALNIGFHGNNYLKADQL